MSKYRNQKTVIDGIRFDSKAESRRYVQLKLLEQAGAISDLKLQPRYRLQEAYKHPRTGKKVQAIHYIGDFQYVQEGQVVVEDVKGKETPLFKVKRKLFEFKYQDIELRITSA